MASSMRPAAMSCSPSATRARTSSRRSSCWPRRRESRAAWYARSACAKSSSPARGGVAGGAGAAGAVDAAERRGAAGGGAAAGLAGAAPTRSRPRRGRTSSAATRVDSPHRLLADRLRLRAHADTKLVLALLVAGKSPPMFESSQSLKATTSAGPWARRPRSASAAWNGTCRRGRRGARCRRSRRGGPARRRARRSSSRRRRGTRRARSTRRRRRATPRGWRCARGRRWSRPRWRSSSGTACR